MKVPAARRCRARAGVENGPKGQQVVPMDGGLYAVRERRRSKNRSRLVVWGESERTPRNAHEGRELLGHAACC